ncbi:hypothetical protein BGZ80_003856, partial [Entomortierella chlamydospora]
MIENRSPLQYLSRCQNSPPQVEIGELVTSHDEEEEETEAESSEIDEVAPIEQKEIKLDDALPVGQTSKNTAKSKRAKPFTAKGRKSFGERFENLGEKWVLRSGTVVEDVIYRSGIDSCKTYCFMLDLSDPQTVKLFSEDDRDEIISDLPSQAVYSEEAYSYMDKFTNIDNVADLENALKDRPTDPDSLIIYECLYQ